MSEHDHSLTAGHHDEHEHHAVNYTAIFGLLCVCTVLSIFFDLFKDKMTYPVLLVLILGVAVCKATFVLLYFMHIKFERAWKYVLLAPTAVLACALPFALAPDIAFHYYSVIVPQRMLAPVEHGSEHAPAGHGVEAHPAADDPPAAAHDHKADGHEADHKEEAHPKAEKAPAKAH